MIGSLRGEIAERNLDGTVLLEVGGVGYIVTVSQRAIAELEPGTPGFLFITTFVKTHRPCSVSLRAMSVQLSKLFWVRTALGRQWRLQ